MAEKRHAFLPAKMPFKSASSPPVSPPRNAISHEVQVAYVGSRGWRRKGMRFRW